MAAYYCHVKITVSHSLPNKAFALVTQDTERRQTKQNTQKTKLMSETELSKPNLG